MIMSIGKQGRNWTVTCFPKKGLIIYSQPFGSQTFLKILQSLSEDYYDSFNQIPNYFVS